MAVSSRQVKNKRDSNGVLTGRPGTVYDVNIKYTAPDGKKKVLCEKGLCHQKGSDAARSGNENEAPKSGANCVNHFTAETDRRKLP